MWIGSYMNDSVNKEYQNLGYTNAASQVSQKNILDGIETAVNSRFDTLGTLVLPAYPKGAWKIPNRRFSHASGSSDLIVGYTNIQYINRLFAQRNLMQSAKAWLSKNKNAERIEIYIYELRSACVKAAQYIKKHHQNVRVHLIVPDLPAFMDLHMSKVKKILKQIDWWGIQACLPAVDDYILYTKHMAEYLKLPEDRWIVMEGSIHANEVVELRKAPKTNAIMYSGLCDLHYGIPLLLEAFSLVEDNNCQLWITGAGNAVNLIQEYAAKDPRIQYFGYLPSRQNLLDKQQQAKAMISMRLPTEEASAYCFPSKLFEYMLSGNPVLSFRIPGIPEEYFDYLVEMADPTVAAVAAAIRQVLQMSEAESTALGMAGRDFVLAEKNNIVQAKKIINFTGEING